MGDDKNTPDFFPAYKQKPLPTLKRFFEGHDIEITSSREASLLDWFRFNGLLTIVGYLMPKSSLKENSSGTI